MKGGTRTTSAKPKEGDWYTDSSGDLHISGSAPLSIRTSGASDQFTSQRSRWTPAPRPTSPSAACASRPAAPTRLATLFTNLKGTATGATATSGDQIVNKTEVHLTLAPYSDNILRQRVKSIVGSGARPCAAARGTSSYRRRGAQRGRGGRHDNPEGGVVPADATLSNGTR
ncbi:MAG: hypothetical protein ACLSDQ_03990 [Adlercreutzia equolifaciens]